MAAIAGGALRDIFDGRTYEWMALRTQFEWDDLHAAGLTGVETRERKAQSVWVRTS